MSAFKEALQKLSGLCGLVFLIFLCMKLTGGISWSWWYVTCPLWGQLPLGFVVGCLMAIFCPSALQDFINDK